MFGIEEDEDEEEQLSPEAKQVVQDSVLARYRDAADPAHMRKVESQAERENTINDVLGAFGNYGRNELAARGLKTEDDPFWSQRKKEVQDRVMRARQAQKDQLSQIRTEGDLDFQEKERSHKLQQFADADQVRKGEMDPKSTQSELARAVAKRMDPKGSYDGMSAFELKQSLPHLEKLYEAEQRRLGRQDSLNFQAGMRADATRAREEAKDDDRRFKVEQKEKEVAEKKKTTLNEIEDRRTNINAALDTLDNMIAEDGTWEAVGPHNQDMERLIEQVATDMAKLQDPNSVARPSEVEQVKRNLISSGFKNSNATARAIIKNFRGEVERRANSAYDIRGMADLNPHKASNVAGGKSGASGSFGEATAAPAGRAPEDMSDEELDAELERLKGGRP